MLANTLATILHSFLDTRPERDRDAAARSAAEPSLSALFERQARATPDAIALQCAYRTMSYGELEERVSALACHLQSLGVGFGVEVRACLERSLEAVIGLLATLKAGGVFAPLSSVEDSKGSGGERGFRRDLSAEHNLGTAVCLTHVKHKVEGSGGTGVATVALEAFFQGDAWRSVRGGRGKSAPPVMGDAPAVILKHACGRVSPEPAMTHCLTHKCLASWVVSETGEKLNAQSMGGGPLTGPGTGPRIGPGDVVLHLAEIHTAEALREILGGLLNGALVAILPASPTPMTSSTPNAPVVPETVPSDSPATTLGIAIRVYQVTVLWLSAPLFQKLVEDRIEDLRPVRQIALNGKQPGAAALSRFRAWHPLCALHMPADCGVPQLPPLPRSGGSFTRRAEAAVPGIPILWR